MNNRLILLLITACFAIYATAQGDNLFYYYKSKKVPLRQIYGLVSVGLKNQEKSKTGIAQLFGVTKDSVQLLADGKHAFVRTGNSVSKVYVDRLITGLNKKLIAFARPAIAGISGKEATYGEDFIVSLKPGTGIVQLQGLLAKHNCVLKSKYPFAEGIYLIAAGETNDYDALKMANLFYESGLFEYAEPDFRTHNAFAGAPNDSLYFSQWAHKNNGGGMSVDSAWLITTGSTDIKIAIMDTGVDTGHADLKANLLQGFDCTTLTSNPGDGRPIYTLRGHGTACAGIVGAIANNSIGVAGIAPDCKIIPVNMMDWSGNFVTDFSIAAGLDYAWQNGAAIISNSWTASMLSGVVNDAIERAAKQGRDGKGAILLFASGNENGAVDYPASNPLVIAVGAINQCLLRKSYFPHDCNSANDDWGSNYGAGLDVVAPGVSISTTDISGKDGYNNYGDYIQIFTGTSSACANAAGVMALILSANPELTATEARMAMETSCDKISGYNFKMTEGNPAGIWNDEVGYGLVNAYKAVQAAISGLFCTVEATAASTMLCKGTSVELSVLNPSAMAAYQWRFNGVANDSSRTTFIAKEAGTYDVTVTHSNGCTAVSAPITVTAPEADSLIADAGGPVSICTGGEAVRIGGMPSARGGVKIVGKKRGYGVYFRETPSDGGLLKFDTENPRDYSLDSIIPLPAITENTDCTGDFTPLGYYLLTRTGNLIRMDTITREQTFIAKLVFKAGLSSNKVSWTGLAWDPVSKQLYAVAHDESYHSYLYTVDLITGIAIVRTPVNAPGLISWIAFNSNGTLFAFYYKYDNGLYDNGIVRLDKHTGSSYGDVAYLNYGEDIYRLDGGFDPLNGKLYLSTYYYSWDGVNQGADLREMDTLTLNTTVKGAVGDFSVVGATSISGGNYDYTWSPSEYLSNSKDANPLANPLKETTYTLTVKDYCGNVAVSSIKITPGAGKPAIKIAAPKDSICEGESVRLSATKNANYHYQWMVDGKIIPDAKDSFYIAPRTGRYQVKITAGRGGCGSTSAIFKVKDCSIKLNNNNNDTTCFSYFYPSGGHADTSYKPNERWTKTIYPAKPGSKLKVNFSAFQVQHRDVIYETNDTLFLYGGSDANAKNELINAFSKWNQPILNHDYHSINGPLTFKFRSGGGNVGTWDAILSCFKPKVYRSRISGKFNRATTWEVKEDDGKFTQAQAFPLYGDDSIIIQTGHTVTIDTAELRLDQVWVQGGAKLVSKSFSLTLMDGTGFDLIADGDVELISNGRIDGKGSILLRGGLTMGYHIEAPLYIDGSMPQAITCIKECGFDSVFFQNGNGVTVSGGPTSIKYLIMQAQGALYVNSGFNVESYLQLKNGVVKVEDKNDLSCGIYQRKAMLHGGNNSSFIDGFIKFPSETAGLIVNSTENFWFPAGYGTTFKPVTLQIQRRGYVPENYFKARYVSKPPPTYNLPTSISKLINTGYWQIENERSIPARPDTVTTGTVSLSYIAADEVLHDTARLRIVKHDGNGNWVDVGGAATHIDTGTITSTIPFSTFGDFSLAWASSTLPVKWLSFSAGMKGKAVELVWRVASEVNCSHYTIEHSTDGLAFTELAKLEAQSNLALSKAYRWLHVNPLRGINYYRIRQVDKDGHFHYSKTEHVSNANGAWYSIAPNPAGNYVLITTNDIVKEVYCYNVHGKLLRIVRPQTYQYRLMLNGLANGLYNLKIVTETAVYNKKLVKTEK
ncbi:S8 family serine peptidase [Foetidibacter luteolus]|uniref:S8 family serine peptidase n=1 Tax=Foetidibacter luteolus TaxID=2608880 RepID=UPI001A9811F7|nr:S8 family serine peptidase [Foetidibacter luteolus]